MLTYREPDTYAATAFFVLKQIVSITAPQSFLKIEID